MFIQLVQELVTVKTLKKHPYIRTVYNLLTLAVTCFLNPLYHIDLIYWLTPSGKQMRELCKFVHKFSENMIHERKKSLGLDTQDSDCNAALERALKQRKYLDFLDISFSQQLTKTESDLEIRHEVDTFIYGSRDTTTSSTCWTLYCLAKYPKHQEKVHCTRSEKWLDYDDLKGLKYTHWCSRRLRDSTHQVTMSSVSFPKILS